MRIFTFAVLVMSTMASAAQVEQPAAQTTRPAARAAAAMGNAGEFASFGVSFTPPAAGWTRLPEGGTGTIARWGRIGADGKATAFISLEMEPTKPGQTAEQYAAERTKTTAGGTIAPSPAVTIDGERTTRVTGSKAGGMVVDSLVALHGNYIYVVGGFANTADLIPRDEMNALAKTVKFSEPVDPSKHTELRNERFPLMNKFSIIPLATMRPNPEPLPPGNVGISTYNFAASRPDFIATIQAVPNERKVSMTELQAQFPGKLAPGKTVTWTKLGAGTAAAGAAGVERSISSTFEAQLGDQRQMTRIALARLGESDIVLVFFSFVSPDATSRSAYEKASEQMAASIEPLPK